MKKVLANISLTMILITLSSCDWFTSPEELKPGRRDYVWTADTLDLVMNDFQSIWGSSPNDVWVGTFQNGETFHYDGEKWEKHSEVGTSGDALYGFAENDVWIGGNDGRIWHYDGRDWTESFRYIDDKFNFAIIMDIWGTDPNNIYAVGNVFMPGNYNDWTENQRAFILHFDGYTWSEEFFADFQSQFIRIRGFNNLLFIYSALINNMTGDSIEFYEYNGQTLSKIYSIPQEENLINTFNNIGNNLFFLIADKVCVYVNGIFDEKFSLQHPNLGGQIFGRNQTDIFVRMKDGLAHYNGEDIEYLYNFEGNWTSILWNAAVFEKEVFFLVSDYPNNVHFVLRGKLTE